MKTSHKGGLITLTSLFLLASTQAMAGMAVTPTNNGTTLVNTLVGSGITIVPGSTSYIGATTQAGTFSGGTSAGIGIESGIILTTGSATRAPGPNQIDSVGITTGTGSDPNLAGNDRNVLQFSFTSAGGNLFFNYVFASEEYNEYTNSSFNDAFASYLDGVNIALIPGTSTLRLDQ